MDNLSKLISELCPAGVEYKPLEQCCVVLDSKRKPVTKSTRESGEYPYYGANGIQDYVSEYIFDGNYILVGEDGSVVTPNGTPVVNWAEGKIWVNNHAHIISEKDGVLLRYLYHYLQTVDVSKLIHGNIPKLTGGDLKAISIPVPPLPVQHEIVRILDNFTELTAELQAELQARKKQYEYYRNHLLSFDNTAPFVTLGEIGQVKMCKRILKEQTSPLGDIPFYKIGTFGKQPDAYISRELFDEYKQKYSYPRKGDILISCAGTIGRTVEFDGEPAYFQDSNIVWLEHDGTKVLNRYLWYCYSRKPWKVSEGGTVARLYNDNILNAEIPLPSLDVQQRLVNVLDNFDAICSDLNIGLPAEIEARQKQYEYYRDLLLTFAKGGLQSVNINDKLSYSTPPPEIKLIQYVFGYAVVRVKEIFKRLKGTPITAEKMKTIATENGAIRVFAGGKTAINANEEDIPNANITKVPSVLVQSRGVIDAIYYEKPFTFKNEMWAYTCKNQVTTKFLFYVLKANIQHFRDAASGMGALPQISISVTDDFAFVLPSLAEQERIVAILDRFDALCNDITIGLPAEIKERQKQYEYYRDKLLSF